MKKRLLTLLLLLATGVSLFAQRELLKRSNADSFSMILLGDPQNYSKYDTNQPIFELMTAWIASQQSNLNIKTVLCTGDLVEQNEYLVPYKKNGNQTSTEQWNAVSRAFKRLDHKIPYINCTGNHDYGYERAENRLSQFSTFFPVNRNSCWRECLVSVCNNAFGVPTLENAAYAFTDKNWGDLLIISMEFAPRDEVLEWAKALAASAPYQGHKVIVLTHSYMKADGSIIEKEGYGVSPANYGVNIWEKLVYPSDNIRMVVCGHYSKAGTFEENVGYREDKNKSGKKVAQMLFNTQTLGGGWQGNGGDGWLRILEFLPDGKTIQVRTFSPYFDFSPETRNQAWMNEPYNRFEVVLD